MFGNPDARVHPSRESKRLFSTGKRQRIRASELSGMAAGARDRSIVAGESGARQGKSAKAHGEGGSSDLNERMIFP